MCASIKCALKTTNKPLDVTYNVLVDCYIPLCNNNLKGEPLDKEGVLRKAFLASIRCALQTTNEPSNVTYNVLVGCYIPLCHNTFKGEPKVVMKNPFVPVLGMPSRLQINH